MAGSFTLNNTTYNTGASNGVSSDITAIGALVDRIDAIVTDWQTAFAANPSSWRAQGGGAGSIAGSSGASAAIQRLKATLLNLTPLNQG